MKVSDKIYPVILEEKELKKFKGRLNQMRIVDEYMSGFSLTSSTNL